MTDMVNAIALKEIVLDDKARGAYCASPYQGHPKGCPNFPKCVEKRIKFTHLQDDYLWYAVIEEFDLQAHAIRMKLDHPKWSERMCRNLLYWQGGVRKRLRAKADKFAKGAEGSIVLDIPEAHGINVFETMAKVGVIINRKPDIVRKVMFIGIPNTVEGIASC